MAILTGPLKQKQRGLVDLRPLEQRLGMSRGVLGMMHSRHEDHSKQREGKGTSTVKRSAASYLRVSFRKAMIAARSAELSRRNAISESGIMLSGSVSHLSRAGSFQTTGDFVT